METCFFYYVLAGVVMGRQYNHFYKLIRVQFILKVTPCPREKPIKMTKFSTPDLSDAAPDAQAIELPFFNFGAKKQFGGSAVTIKCHEDNSLVKQCVAEPGEGRVMVVDGSGSMRRALLGDMLAKQAAGNGWAGLIINGAIRDVDEIATIELGVQALGTCPVKTEKLGMGQRDVAVFLGGVKISTGDHVYADNNGVLVSTEALL